MDLSLFVSSVVMSFWWLIPLTLVMGLLKSPWFKGILGEALVKFIAKRRLPEETYHRLHDVTLPTLDGSTQIDHIFVSQFGIFVVETKNMKGWIFGSENQTHWTQKIFKQTFKFQNPLRQNYKHVKALQSVLSVPAETIHSLVVFMGEGRFKTPMPANVTKGAAYIRYIKSFTQPVLTDSEVQAVMTQIQSGRLAPTRATHRQHVQQLKQRANPNAERKCPKCGSRMILRTVKQGLNAGNAFWGCSAVRLFPNAATCKSEID